MSCDHAVGCCSFQNLVTNNEFKDSDLRKQLSETIGSLLELCVLPIFNENDAMSTTKTPYKVFIPTMNLNHKLCL